MDAMNLDQCIARCEREIETARLHAQKADNEQDRYGFTWAEIDWIVAKQMYEEERDQLRMQSCEE